MDRLMRAPRRGCLVVLIVMIVLALYGEYQSVTTRTEPSAWTSIIPLSGDQLASAFYGRLPPGLRDYIRSNWPELLPEAPATNPPLGIDLPAGARQADLPPGVSDYLRDHPKAPPTALPAR